MYPIEKYKFIQNGNKVIALTRDDGKTIRGVAICSENDTFDLEKGKELAAARCALKVARRRWQRAKHKHDTYAEIRDSWFNQTQKALNVMIETNRDYDNALDNLHSILLKLE